MSVKQILELLDEHEDRRLRTLNLVASENVLSPAARYALAHDMGQRYCIPPADERPPSVWDYPNQRWVREMQRCAEHLACEAFGAAVADVRPLSGNNAAYILLNSLLKAGDRIASVPATCGGHFATEVICAREGVERIDLPYDTAAGRVDVAATARLSDRAPLRLVFLDASMQLFAHPVRQLRAALPPEVVLAYDASHTMGIIAGSQFQDPLAEGANLIQGSTHKSLFGPQKALFAFRQDDDTCRRVRDSVSPLFVSNAHPHHTAALTVALQEALDFGAEYAARVIGNAKALAGALHAADLEIPFAEAGFTDCHQFTWVVGDWQQAEARWRRLENAGLHMNLVRAPFTAGRYGLRIGTSELTRRGTGPAEMTDIARLAARASEAEDSGGPAVRRAVVGLSGAFPRVYFGYDRDGTAQLPPEDTDALCAG